MITLAGGGSPMLKNTLKETATMEIRRTNIVADGDCGGTGVSGGSRLAAGHEVVTIVSVLWRETCRWQSKWWQC